jgi:hypothetical protein
MVKNPQNSGVSINKIGEKRRKVKRKRAAVRIQ